MKDQIDIVTHAALFLAAATLLYKKVVFTLQVARILFANFFSKVRHTCSQQCVFYIGDFPL